MYFWDRLKGPILPALLTVCCSSFTPAVKGQEAAAVFS